MQVHKKGQPLKCVHVKYCASIIYETHIHSVLSATFSLEVCKTQKRCILLDNFTCHGCRRFKKGFITVNGQNDPSIFKDECSMKSNV